MKQKNGKDGKRKKAISNHLNNTCSILQEFDKEWKT